MPPKAFKVTNSRLRESHWLVMRRCLAIIRRLQRGPATREELLQAVLKDEGDEAYGRATGKALRRRFENDLARIRQCLRIDVRYDRRVSEYVIGDALLPLLDLPDRALATIAFLEQTFGPDAPMHDDVHKLLAILRSYLPPERCEFIERQRIALSVDLGQRDEDEIDPSVWDGLGWALIHRQRVMFDYYSPEQEDRLPRRHVVDPYDRYFDTVRGHYYLWGWCHYTVGPMGRFEQNRYFHYRLGRMANLETLPDKLPPFPPRTPRYEVIYELTPQVARLGISRHPGIEITQVEKRDDGSAVVHAQSADVFWAVRSLLHYGSNCRVLGGPEMLREMRATVHKMAETYAEEG